MSEELNDRDHRVLGKRMDLFCSSPLVGPGLILWMPNGGIIRMELQNFMQGELIKRGYSPVYTPHIGSIELYKTSGHFPYYKDSQYPTIKSEEKKPDGEPVEEYLLKPMNCPHHAQIFAARPRSYRDLPIRLAEFGTVYRYEQAGSLNGMSRVRGLTQDDAHLFCSPDQVEQELRSTIDLVVSVFKMMGFSEYRVQISLRDPAEPKYVGDPAVWDKAEETLQRVAKESGLNSEIMLGEAAFYGPKIDFMVKDCIGREWQLGTVQLDYNLPDRFKLEFIGSDGQPHQPVMIHRAPFGSLERFFAILTEHFAGDFPLWMAPVHARIANIAERHADAVRVAAAALRAGGLRTEEDLSSDRVNAKVASAELAKVPFFLVIGDREAGSQSVSVRGRNGKNFGSMKIDEFLSKANGLIRNRALKPDFL